MRITEKMWNNYIIDSSLHDRPFNIFIKEEIEKKLKELPHIVDKDADIEIASISFAFKNRPII